MITTPALHQASTTQLPAWPALLVTAAVGAVVGGPLDLAGLRMALVFAMALLGLGGTVGLLAIRNPAREVAAADCPGGQLAGSPVAASLAPDCARP
jgi:hypothetical protein